jgi:hypothetical protein
MNTIAAPINLFKGKLHQKCVRDPWNQISSSFTPPNRLTNPPRRPIFALPFTKPPLVPVPVPQTPTTPPPLHLRILERIQALRGSCLIAGIRGSGVSPLALPSLVLAFQFAIAHLVRLQLLVAALLFGFLDPIVDQDACADDYRGHLVAGWICGREG